MVSYIPGGCLRFQPSTVVVTFHLRYFSTFVVMGERVSRGAGCELLCMIPVVRFFGASFRCWRPGERGRTPSLHKRVQKAMRGQRVVFCPKIVKVKEI